YIAATAASAVLLLVCGEIVVRATLPFNNPDTMRKYALQYIPSVFSRHRLKPMGQVVEEDGDKGLGRKKPDDEPAYRYFINDIGYRGRNFLPRKPQGTTRILVVGGSTVFDGYSKDPASGESTDWPHVTEQLLRNDGFNGDTGKKNVEVING